MPSYLSSEENLRRERRSRLVYSVTAGTIGALGIFLALALRDLLLPLAIGVVMAYLCLPLVGYLKDRGFSHLWAILSLSGLFSLLLISTLNLVGNTIPDAQTKLELQVQTRYKINLKFNRLMGLETNPKHGNWLYVLIGPELEPLREGVDVILRFSADDQDLFASYYRKPGDLSSRPIPERIWQYHLANLARDKELFKEPLAKQGSSSNMFFTTNHSDSMLRTIISTASLWLLTPLVFLTLLFDDGRIMQNLIRIVPNRYFELALTVIENINVALGRYLRGTALECLMVGISFSFCLFLIGVDPRWALLIGAIAGITNAIPFLGTAIGLVLGMLYVILAENISPLLPFINSDNLILAVMAAVFLVHLADNAIFQPLIMGSAVNLHPLVVILGVMGGTLLCGFAGMLFAIPTIIICKVIITSTFRQLQAYSII